MGRKKKPGRPKGSKSKTGSFSLIGFLKDIIVQCFVLIKKGVVGLPGKLKRYILSSLMFLLTLISFLSFFDLAGQGGESLKTFIFSLFGHVAYIFPLIFFCLGLIFFSVLKKLVYAGLFSVLIFTTGFSGLLDVLDIRFFSGGRMGEILAKPLIGYFGELVSFFVFLLSALVGVLGYWYVLSVKPAKEEEQSFSSSVKKLFSSSKFKVAKVDPEKVERGGILKKKQEDKEEVIDPKKSKSSIPPFNLLEVEKDSAVSGNIKENSITIEKTLENFSIKTTMAEVNVGPTVTQYTLKPAAGVKLSKITGLSSNLALNLAAHPIRIEAPIPGKSLVGVEVPNKTRSKVRLRKLLSDSRFKKEVPNLGIALGRDVSGGAMFADLTKMPHLLVAGATGTGKTIFLNSLILSLLYGNTPEDLKLILIDPKRVEFSVYKSLPHLLAPVIYGGQESVNALSWLVEEMERRFQVLSDEGVRNIAMYNESAKKKKEKPLPYIVLIIDELADLMSSRGKEMEVRVVRIAQMARAVGIHLVLATQRPSTEVITGLIKANITSRVAFQVPTQIDSRTILDGGGAEKLLGLGDMLYVSAETVKPKRAQGAFVSEKEVKKVVAWIIEKIGPMELIDNGISSKFQEYLQDTGERVEAVGQLKEDPLYEEAKRVVMRSRKASASLLQRMLSVGYVRAARLLDMLEAEGVIGPAEGAKPRKVYYQEDDSEEGFE